MIDKIKRIEKYLLKESGVVWSSYAIWEKVEGDSNSIDEVKEIIKKKGIGCYIGMDKKKERMFLIVYYRGKYEKYVMGHMAVIEELQEMGWRMNRKYYMETAYNTSYDIKSRKGIRYRDYINGMSIGPVDETAVVWK